jgi:hypothetical protein
MSSLLEALSASINIRVWEIIAKSVALNQKGWRALASLIALAYLKTLKKVRPPHPQKHSLVCSSLFVLQTALLARSFTPRQMVLRARVASITLLQSDF